MRSHSIPERHLRPLSAARGVPAEAVDTDSPLLVEQILRRALTARQRFVLKSLYLEGDTLETVGVALGRSAATVRQIESQALRIARNWASKNEPKARPWHRQPPVVEAIELKPPTSAVHPDPTYVKPDYEKNWQIYMETFDNFVPKTPKDYWKMARAQRRVYQIPASCP